MNKINEATIRSLYSTNEYITKNPTLHEEDSPWKVSKITPLIDEMFNLGYINDNKINLLDVGGGAGIILRDISNYIDRYYGIKVNKYALDLSPDMLEIQKKHNPCLRILNEDIRETSLANKEIDLALMIDVLEHVPNPIKALTELRRIAKVVIFKVPLESNILYNTIDIMTDGKSRERSIKQFGHINIYNYWSLKSQIENYCGKIIDDYYTNVFDYYLTSDQYAHKTRTRVSAVHYVASCVFGISPKLCACLFSDFVMILAECKRI